MKTYNREYPMFALCGLNCGLCPRFQSKSASRCPGCGGQDFVSKHPSCTVITCNAKHDNVEYCFQCSSYPCEKYVNPSSRDSFISYRNVISDFEKARISGLESYKTELNKKVEFLKFLVNEYNDGRKTSAYCVAVNLLALEDLNEIKKHIEEKFRSMNMPQKEKIEFILSEIKTVALVKNIDLKLRK